MFASGEMIHPVLQTGRKNLAATSSQADLSAKWLALLDRKLASHSVISAIKTVAESEGAPDSVAWGPQQVCLWLAGVGQHACATGPNDLPADRAALRRRAPKYRHAAMVIRDLLEGIGGTQQSGFVERMPYQLERNR